MDLKYYVYEFRILENGKCAYFYERTTGTEEAAKSRVKELKSRGIKAVYLINHTIKGAYY